MKLFKTVRDSYKRLSEESVDLLQKKTKGIESIININSQQKYQTIKGFGGAITESSAYTLSKLSKEQRDRVLESYYDKNEGIGYTLGRIHIHSCDFSLGNYTYVEEGDMTLDTFSLKNDNRYLLPLIKDVLKKTNNELTLLASPWSPPAYMKTNNEMNNGGKLKNDCKQLWADYFVKYINHMKQEGIDIWGISVQNEPAATQVWDSCVYTAQEERDFIKNYLGPTLEKAGLGDKKIIIWDHNRDIVVERAKPILEDKECAKYVWGTGIHWYMCEDFENTTKLHDMFPDKHIIFTEGCNEGGVKLYAWNTGERYGRNIIGDLNNFVEAWIDWNIVLDETGGPNHVGNLCDSPIIVDTKNKIVHYNSSYYYIAHFSKFIKPNAIRINSVIDSKNDKLYSLSCINEDNSKIIVIMNESDKCEYIQINLDEDNIYYLNIEPHSISTLII